MTDSTEHLLALARDAAARSRLATSKVDGEALQRVVEVVHCVRASLARGGKLLIFGNGGSASDAQHIAAEFVGRYVRERQGLAAIALNTDTSALTAIGNDYGYEAVFARQVEALARPDDVVIGLSTSGNSPNVVAALQRANDIGCTTVALTSARPARCHEVADITVAAPATETARIQECHILFGHIMCELMDATPEEVVTERPAVYVGVTDELRAEREHWRECGLRVVLTNGVFDLLHAGHLASLEAARHEGDVLVVAINSDASVRRLKGAGRPVVGEADRSRLVAALTCTDRVVVFDADDPADVVAELQPDVWCKGGDYADRDPSTIPEIAVVESYGGEVVFLPMVDGLSTTSTIERLRSTSLDT